MAKAKGKSKFSFDFKKFFLEKGEKVGLIVAGVGLALMALMGIMAATKAASPSTISKNLKDGAQNIDTKLQTASDTPAKVTLSGGSQAFRKVSVNEFVTPNDYFDTASSISEKRVKPMALAPVTGQAVYAIGGIGIYDIFDGKIAVIVGRTAAQNDISKVKDKQKKGAHPKVLQQVPGQPGAGGVPAAVIGGSSGAGGAPKGPSGGPGGGFKRSEEKDINYMEIDSPAIEKAELAINLRPERMAVVRAVVPYKEQVGRYLTALRLPNDAALEADKSAPHYRGFDVERLVLNSKGEVVKEDGQPDWQPFDHLGVYADLFRVTARFEPEDEAYKDFVPDKLQLLYLRRPKLESGGYSIPTMQKLQEAKDELKKTGPPRELSNREKKITGKGADLFGDSDDHGAAPGGPGGGPQGKTLPGVPTPLPKGPGGSPKGGPAQPRNNTMPVWILQFIDPTIVPGYSYKYRVRLKLENPNFGRTKDVANPGLAEEGELVSDWTEIPDVVSAPLEEFLYASGERRPDDGAYGTSAYDTTTFRFHKWTDYVRVTRDSPAQDPIGAWILADVNGRRGQYIHQEKKAKIPLWSMVHKTYILRQRSGKPSRSMENVSMDFMPSTPVLLVDFEGGKGYYQLPSGVAGVNDESTVEALVITDDGRTMAVTARNAAADKELPEKQAREIEWKNWLDEVERNTLKSQ